MQDLLATAMPFAMTVLGVWWLVVLMRRLWRVRSGTDAAASPSQTSRGQVVSELLVAALLLVLLRGSAVSLPLQAGWLLYLVATAAVVWLAVHRWPALPARRNPADTRAGTDQAADVVAAQPGPGAGSRE